MAIPISVVVPVGPQREYLAWLLDCLDSILEQEPDEIVIVDDQANLYHRKLTRLSPCITYRKNPWLCGCAMSWNFGISYARNQACFLMGSDDRLLPGCLSSCMKTYEESNWLDAWYNVTCQIQTGEIVDSFNNACMVTKGLWSLLGGFAPSSFAAPDGWAISIMMIHHPSRLIQVEKGNPLYWCRVHSAQDTPRVFGKYMDAAIMIRDIDTRTWVKPEWTERIEW
jgi:glycosyltransferase involved in cell wall biosynthesis